MPTAQETQDFFNWFNTLTPAEQANFQATFGTGEGPVPSTATPAPAAPAPAADPNVTPVTPPTAPAAETNGNATIFGQWATFLTSIGLGDLFTIGPDGAPGGWLWTQVQNGVDNDAEFQMQLEQTQQFQQRFPVIGQARERIRNGGTGIVPNAIDVLRYETEVGETLRFAGLPAFMYEDRAYLQGLMGQELSADEVEARLGSAWNMVRNTDPAVLNQFAEFFGVQGDAALAAFFLDPTRTGAQLDRMARTAYTSGMGQTLGIDIGQQVADRIASLPKTEGGIWQDLTELNRLDRAGGVFSEGITETEDLGLMDEGLDAVVFGEGDAAAAIERRILERKANDRSSLGGAAITQAGAVGIGR